MARAVPLNKKVESFVKEQVAEARERLTVVEAGAEKLATDVASRAQDVATDVATKAEKAANTAVKEIRTRAKVGQKEVRKVLNKVKLDKDSPLNTLRNRAENVAGELGKALQSVQSRLFEASGVATQSQLRSLAKDVQKLNKKVEALLKSNA
ncbi:MAG: hypothetical protein ACJ790_11170 [Myxococcaceae bacterium]